MFNYIVLGYNSELYKCAYGDIIQQDNVVYMPNTINTSRSALCMPTSINRILYLLYRLHHSPRINNLFKLPFKNIWFKKYYNHNFKHDKPVCFLFFSRNVILEEYGFINFLKKKHPSSKFVCYFQDLVSTHAGIDMDYIKSLFDLVISFDHREAKEYNLGYFPLVNSKYNFDLTSEIKESDVYFLGVAKNRLNDIIAAYEALKEKNLRCDFYITGVAIEDQKYADDICYIDSMSYLDNLRHVAKTNCILELMQKDGHGYTQRMMEAITYDKKIITNNPEVKSAPFYDPSNILHFDSAEMIATDHDFFVDFSRIANHGYKDKLSPIRLLDFIATKLQKVRDNS